MDKLAAELGIDPVELRLLNALAPGDTLPTGQVIRGALPVADVIRRAADLAPPKPEELPRDPIRLPGGAGNTTRGEGVKRGVGFAVGFKNICYSEGFDDSCAARVILTVGTPPPRSTAPRRRSARASPCVILQVARTSSVATTSPFANAGTAHGRVGRLRVRVPVDVHGCRRRRSSRAARRWRSTGWTGAPTWDVELVYHHPRTWPLDPETGQTTGDRSHVALAVAAMRVVAEVDVEFGLTWVVGSEWRGRRQGDQPAGGPRPDRGRHRAGSRAGADGGDPDP